MGSKEEPKFYTIEEYVDFDPRRNKLLLKWEGYPHEENTWRSYDDLLGNFVGNDPAATEVKMYKASRIKKILDYLPETNSFKVSWRRNLGKRRHSTTWNTYDELAHLSEKLKAELDKFKKQRERAMPKIGRSSHVKQVERIEKYVPLQDNWEEMKFRLEDVVMAGRGRKSGNLYQAVITGARKSRSRKQYRVLWASDGGSSWVPAEHVRPYKERNSKPKKPINRCFWGHKLQIGKARCIFCKRLPEFSRICDDCPNFVACTLCNTNLGQLIKGTEVKLRQGEWVNRVLTGEIILTEEGDALFGYSHTLASRSGSSFEPFEISYLKMAWLNLPIESNTSSHTIPFRVLQKPCSVEDYDAIRSPGALIEATDAHGEGPTHSATSSSQRKLIDLSGDTSNDGDDDDDANLLIAAKKWKTGDSKLRGGRKFRTNSERSGSEHGNRKRNLRDESGNDDAWSSSRTWKKSKVRQSNNSKNGASTKRRSKAGRSRGRKNKAEVKAARSIEKRNTDDQPGLSEENSCESIPSTASDSDDSVPLLQEIRKKEATDSSGSNSDLPLKQRLGKMHTTASDPRENAADDPVFLDETSSFDSDSKSEPLEKENDNVRNVEQADSDLEDVSGTKTAGETEEAVANEKEHDFVDLANESRDSEAGIRDNFDIKGAVRAYMEEHLRPGLTLRMARSDIEKAHGLPQGFLNELRDKINKEIKLCYQAKIRQKKRAEEKSLDAIREKSEVETSTKACAQNARSKIAAPSISKSKPGSKQKNPISKQTLEDAKDLKSDDRRSQKVRRVRASRGVKTGAPASSPSPSSPSPSSLAREERVRRAMGSSDISRQSQAQPGILEEVFGVGHSDVSELPCANRSSNATNKRENKRPSKRTGNLAASELTDKDYILRVPQEPSSDQGHTKATPSRHTREEEIDQVEGEHLFQIMKVDAYKCGEMNHI
mmetsp:Transcript_7494/g.10554  ORF Transcript_7494/g.10554 Transcript_7494/m.10554 type:complete len:942 (-) Transcript_7494:648-3473(-)